MKKLLFFLLTLTAIRNSFGQDMQPRERANFIAKEVFSKSKYKKVEKYGVTKEMSKVITSTPVIKTNIKDYSGFYKAHGPDYTLTLNITDENNITANIKEVSDHNIVQHFTLKNITIKQALFKAVKVGGDGAETPLEGVFIDKNDNGNVEFGLGLKLSESITVNNSIQTDRLFFKKVR